MLDNIRRKSSQISFDLYKSILPRLYAFSPKVLKLDLGKLRLGKKATKSFRYFGQRHPFTSEVCSIKNVAFQMLECSAGPFEMGHQDRDDNPTRPEVIESPFLLGETEVTQELYQVVMDTNPSKFKNNSQNPVEWVSWVDAILFCNKLSKLEGLNACYSFRKTKVGILRSEMPRDKKGLVRYNKFYDSIRSYVLEMFEENNPYNVELEIEYDPAISTCDVVITDRREDGAYSIESNWVEGMKGKYSLNLALYLDFNPYLLNKATKEELDELLSGCRIPIVECDFGKNGYRLPKEKEWEYAAKAGTKNQWAGTNNDKDLENYACFGESLVRGSTHPVKSKLPNEWGFYDMSGNVEEGCWDKYNPKAPNPSADRVARGGGWYYDASYLLSAYRSYYLPGRRDHSHGFRVCRSIVN